jgi:hypothetical protein
LRRVVEFWRPRERGAAKQDYVRTKITSALAKKEGRIAGEVNAGQD